MIDRDELRRKKRQECDAYIEKLHKLEPELAEISNEIGKLSLRLIREGILKKNTSAQADIDKQVQQLMKRRNELLAKYNLDENIYEPKWDCPICKDLGYVTAGVACECLKKERMEQLKEESGIPRGLWEKSFDNFGIVYYRDVNKIWDVVRYCQSFAQNIGKGENAGNLILLGDVGRGKTHLSVAIAMECLKLGKRVYYTRLDELMELIRNEKFNNDGDLRYVWMKECDLLVLDDFGAENSNSDFTVNQLRVLLEERNLAEKSWVINSNLSLGKIEELYTSRVMDRMLEKGKIFQLDSEESIRLTLRKENMG